MNEHIMSILDTAGVLTLTYSCVAVYRFCSVGCLIIICFSLLFSNCSTSLFNIIFMFVFCFVYPVFLCGFVFCFSFCM